MLSDEHWRSLPKAHLHIHLEGAMRPSTLSEWCERDGIIRPADTRGQRFADFTGFLAVYRAAAEAVRSADDLARLIAEVVADAAEQGVWWIELAFDGDRYSTMRAKSEHRLFDTAEQCWQFALRAGEQAGRASGVGVAFISAVDRTMSLETALSRATLTAQLKRDGTDVIASSMPSWAGHYPAIVGFGLHGNEQGYPPGPFADAFAVALDGSGLLSTPHAGEIAPAPGQGAQSVRVAIEQLRANRIQHGVLALEDPSVVAQLAAASVCLDVAPSSNYALNVVHSLESHPLPELIGAGVACSLASDDPLLFGPNLIDEYRICHQKMGLSPGEIASLARNSFVHSGAPAVVKQAGLAAIDDWSAALPSI